MRRARVGALLVLIGGAGASLVLLTPSAQAKPAASFTYYPPAPASGEPVTFTSTSIWDGVRPIVEQAWDLDDDGQFDDGAGSTATWTFARPGQYWLALHVVDDAKRDATATLRLEVRNRAPAASFVATPTGAKAGDPVTLLSTSSDPDGYITSFAWDLDGDGQFDDQTGNEASLVFPVGAVYKLGLQVTDDAGGVASSVTFMNVAALPVTVSQAPRLLSPFPVVRINGIVSKKGMQVRLLSVSAPIGARVRVQCRGGGCPFRVREQTVRNETYPRAKGNGLVRIRRFARRMLRPGTTIQISVTKPGAIGKYTRFRVRGGKLPRRSDRCLLPGTSPPLFCSAA